MNSKHLWRWAADSGNSLGSSIVTDSLIEKDFVLF